MTTIKNKRILITGCSFIGSHLLEQLEKLKPKHIRIVNKSSKHRHYFSHVKGVEFHMRDLRNIEEAKKSLKNIDIVFHLAADHGGRGYVNLFQGNTSSNLLLDGSVFYAALANNIEKIFYASSGCVYPNYLQQNVLKKTLLKESVVKPPHDADNMYGWAKLMGELTLKAYYKDYGLQSAIGRFFTVYGERASESHAVIASIAKAFTEQDPYIVWGNGKQIRNWTYVKDIVEGIIQLTRKVKDSTAVNLGSNERITVNQMVRSVCKKMKFKPKKIRYVKMPTGPLNRVSNNRKAQSLINWKPSYSFEEGLMRTINWYKAHKNKADIKRKLSDLLVKG